MSDQYLKVLVMLILESNGDGSPVTGSAAIGFRMAVQANGASGVDLESLLGNRQDRSFIAVTFLALLELSKRHEVSVSQELLWGPITIRGMEGA